VVATTVRRQAHMERWGWPSKTDPKAVQLLLAMLVLLLVLLMLLQVALPLVPVTEAER